MDNPNEYYQQHAIQNSYTNVNQLEQYSTDSVKQLLNLNNNIIRIQGHNNNLYIHGSTIRIFISKIPGRYLMDSMQNV